MSEKRNILNFVVTLKSGGDFSPFDVETLCRQVRKHLTIPHNFICYTDMSIKYKYVKTRKLTRNLPGWWSMLEMFKIIGPTIASGLDMIVLDNIDRLGELAKTCPKDVFYMAEPQQGAKIRGEKFCSGLQLWNGNWSWLFKLFKEEDFKFQREQTYTYTKLLERRFKIRKVQEYFDGYYSFKHHCKQGKKPRDAKVVLFHGKPRPKDCKIPWVKEVYESTIEETHPFEEMKGENNAKSNKEV